MCASTYKSASDISKLRLLASPLVLASDMLTLSLSVFSSLFSWLTCSSLKKATKKIKLISLMHINQFSNHETKIIYHPSACCSGHTINIICTYDIIHVCAIHKHGNSLLSICVRSHRVWPMTYAIHFVYLHKHHVYIQ